MRFVSGSLVAPSDEPATRLRRYRSDDSAVWTATAALLPTPQETELLRACLLDGESCRRAWETWRLEVVDVRGFFAADRRGVKTLMPLLLANLRRSGVVLDRETLAYLRTAWIWEGLRSKAYFELCAAVLEGLRSRSVEAIVLKGPALAEAVYPDRRLRHCGDIDLLVHERDLQPAVQGLVGLGLRPLQAGSDHGRHHLTALVDESGVSVELHRGLLSGSEGTSVSEFWDRSRRQAVAGVEARVLSPADNLLHVCAHAMQCRAGASLRWVCDAWMMIACHSGLEWTTLVTEALRSELSLSASTTLGYLAEELGCPVPQTVLDRLGAQAKRATRRERSSVLYGALSRFDDAGSVLRLAGSRRAKLSLLWWRLFPPPEHLRWRYGSQGPWRLPARYLQRIWQYAVNRAAR